MKIIENFDETYDGGTGNLLSRKRNDSLQESFGYDNLERLLSVVDENGTKVFDASYDAWGKQVVTLNTIGLHRGYTGHEMLSEFDIINMNQRSLSRHCREAGKVTAACTILFSAASSARTITCRCRTTAKASTATAIA